MDEGKWTLIDKKTQIASFIILIFVLLALFLVAFIFLNPLIIPAILIAVLFILLYYSGRRLELRNDDNNQNKKLLDLKIAILLIISIICVFSINLVNSLAYNLLIVIYFTLIIDFVILLCYIGRIIELRKQTLKKYKDIKKKISIKAIISFFILIILFSSINYISNYKTYQGLSIKEVKNNYEKYQNQTVTFQAWYYNGDEYLSSIVQYDVFGEYEDSITVNIDHNIIDTSMLMRAREYRFTGTFHREHWIREHSYEGETWTKSGNSTYLNITKIEALYDDLERHNTSRFIGTWKIIEDDNEPYNWNQTWIFFENNSLQVITDYTSNNWDYYTVDDDLLYIEDYEYSPVTDYTFVDEYYANYLFSEKNTKLRIEINNHWEDIYVFQKI